MAYEIEKLTAKLKAKGLDVAEEGARVVLDAVVEYIEEGAVESENKLDDILVPLVVALKPLAEKAIDKIDGKEG
jgi:hypothetical protein